MSFVDTKNGSTMDSYSREKNQSNALLCEDCRGLQSNKIFICTTNLKLSNLYTTTNLIFVDAWILSFFFLISACVKKPSIKLSFTT